MPGGAGEPSQVTYDLSANLPANSIFSHDDPDPATSSVNSVQPAAKAPNLNSSSVGPDFAARSEADSGAGKAGQASRSATVSYLDLAGPPQDLPAEPSYRLQLLPRTSTPLDLPTINEELRGLRTEFSVETARPVPAFNPQLDVLNKDQMSTRFPLLQLGERDRSPAQVSRAEIPPALPTLQRRFSAPTSPSSVDLHSVSNLGNALQQALEHLDPSDTIQLGQRAPVVNLDQLNARQRRNVTRPSNYKDFHTRGTR